MKQAILAVVIVFGLAGLAAAQVSECGYLPGMKEQAESDIRGARSLLTQAQAAKLAGDPSDAEQDTLMAKSMIEGVCSRRGTQRVWDDLTGGPVAPLVCKPPDTRYENACVPPAPPTPKLPPPIALDKIRTVWITGDFTPIIKWANKNFPQHKGSCLRVVATAQDHPDAFLDFNRASHREVEIELYDPRSGQFVYKDSLPTLWHTWTDSFNKAIGCVEPPCPVFHWHACSTKWYRKGHLPVKAKKK